MIYGEGWSRADRDLLGDWHLLLKLQWLEYRKAQVVVRDACNLS